MDREAYENAHAQHRETRRDGGTYVPHQHRYDPAESAGCLECGELATMAELGASALKILRGLLAKGEDVRSRDLLGALSEMETRADALGLLEARP